MVLYPWEGKYQKLNLVALAILSYFQTLYCCLLSTFYLLYRFGTSKYIPPDRSEEIRPMQDLLKEKQKADEAADAATKNTVIKVLMGEVQVKYSP